MTRLNDINEQLSENNRYYIDEYGIGFVGRGREREYLEKVKSFTYNNGCICRPLLIEIDKYPECYKIGKINEKNPWETRIVHRR
jgi:hypothetical protein